MITKPTFFFKQSYKLLKTQDNRTVNNNMKQINKYLPVLQHDSTFQKEELLLILYYVQENNV